MTELQASLYSLDSSGEWATFHFTELEPLMDAARFAQALDNTSAVLHVGFWHPLVSDVTALTASCPGVLLVSDPAAQVLADQLAVSTAAIGCIRGVVFRQVVADLQRPALASPDDALAHVPADTASTLEEPANKLPGLVPTIQAPDWLGELESTNPDLVAQAHAARVVDEESYLRLEATLPRRTRLDLGLARFALVSGASPELETILDNLWAAPPWFMDLAVVKLGLTVRQANVFRVSHIQRVADIAAIRREGLMKLPNLGQGSVFGLQKLLLFALQDGAGLLVGRGDGAGELTPAAIESPSNDAEPGNLRAGFRRAAGLLSDPERHVWAGRLGFECPQMTLQQLADGMGVTRERVRQLEAQVYRRVEHHPFWEHLAIRLEAALQSRSDALLLDDLPAADAWFADAPQLATALIEVLERLLHHRLGVILIGQKWVISQLSAPEWEGVCNAARDLLESGVGDRIEESLMRWQLDQLLTGKGEELRAALWNEMTSSALWSTDSGQVRRLASPDRSANSVALAVLESSDQPLHFEEIHRLAHQWYSSTHDLRSMQNAAHAVGILLGRGTFGLAKHCPLSAQELALVQAEVEDVVSAGDAARQWHASELYNTLLERGLGFDRRLTKYIVNYALKGSAVLVDLKRMVWGLGGEWQAGAASRLDVRQAVIGMLEEQGRPMSTAEIRDRLAQSRGVNHTFQIFPADPLVRIGPGLWGLLHPIHRT